MRPCLAARLSRRVGGVPRAPGLLLSCRRGWFRLVSRREGLQPGDCGGDLAGPGPAFGELSRRRRPPRARRPATENRRSRSRFGSQRRAVPVRASICVQASSSQARATISHQSWFWAKPFSGRFRSPVSFALRIRSSHRARRRCRSSRSASWPLPGVGGEGGEAVPVDVGEPQLRAGVRPLLADDDPHPGWPGGQVEQAGDVRDPGAVPDLPVAVVSRRPGRQPGPSGSAACMSSVMVMPTE